MKEGIKMPKINREEYEVLKGLDSKGFTHLGRNDDSVLWAFSSTPTKRDGCWYVTDLRDKQNFLESEDDIDIVDESDSEPYSIAELIEEYEKEELRTITVNPPSFDVIKLDYGTRFSESEETEVKDLEWLRGRFRGRKIFTPQNDREIGYNTAIDEFSEYVDQLDEPEVLSSDWIDDHKEGIAWSNIDTDTSEVTYYIKEEDLQEVLAPRKDKVKVPEWFSTWYLASGYEKSLYGAFNYLYTEKKFRMDIWSRQYETGHAELQQDIAKVYEYGSCIFEVEEEYYAKIKHWNLYADFVGAKYWGTIPFDNDNGKLSIVNWEHAKKFTKEAWAELGINDNNAEFELVGEKGE